MKGYTELKDLLKEINRSGIIATDQASAVEYQDMLAQLTADQTRELANGELRRAYYRLYDVAAGTLNTIEHYMNTSDKVSAIIEERDAAEQEAEKAREEAKRTKAELEKGREAIATMHTAWMDEKNKNDELQAMLDSCAAEIMKLKARLYDMEHAAD